MAFQTAKSNWFAFSGTNDGRIVYQKTFITPFSRKTLTVTYPSTGKSRFDDAVARLANSFEEYEEYVGKVWTVAAGEPGGDVIFADETNAENPKIESTTCHYEEPQSTRFEAVRKDQIIRVAGRPRVEPVPAGRPARGIYNVILMGCELKEVRSAQD